MVGALAIAVMRRAAVMATALAAAAAVKQFNLRTVGAP